MSQKILEVKNLTKYFKAGGKQVVHAVDNVSFSLEKGKTLGLVGESGCGKSSCARTVIRLYDPTSGQIILDGQDITHMRQKELQPIRKKMQMIFQDPYASLNARMTVRDIIAEPLIAHHIIRKKAEADEYVFPMLERMGLSKEHANRYAHEFSGGQRQRVGIARALILQPELVICDEPISALDVSIQAQVINLLKDYQEEKGLSYLFIAHDLSMVRYVSDDPGFIYDCAAELGNTYDEKYGEDLTDPTRSNSRTKADRDDFVGGDAEFVGQWKADNEKISETVFDGEETKLLLRFDSIKQSDGEPGASLAISFVPMSEMW